VASSASDCLRRKSNWYEYTMLLPGTGRTIVASDSWVDGVVEEKRVTGKRAGGLVSMGTCRLGTAFGGITPVKSLSR
jgi:hypothetical protein